MIRLSFIFIFSLIALKTIGSLNAFADSSQVRVLSGFSKNNPNVPCELELSIQNGNLIGFKPTGYSTGWVVNILSGCKGITCSLDGRTECSTIKGSICPSTPEVFNEFGFQVDGSIEQNEFSVKGKLERGTSDESTSYVEMEVSPEGFHYSEKVYLSNLIPVGKKTVECTFSKN